RRGKSRAHVGEREEVPLPFYRDEPDRRRERVRLGGVEGGGDVGLKRFRDVLHQVLREEGVRVGFSRGPEDEVQKQRTDCQRRAVVPQRHRRPGVARRRDQDTRLKRFVLERLGQQRLVGRDRDGLDQVLERRRVFGR